MSPDELRELARRLRGDILDAVPDDNDMQHVLEMSATGNERLAAVAEWADAYSSEKGYNLYGDQQVDIRRVIRGGENNEKNRSEE
ncbi:MAG: hypothetical protein ACTH32_06395 [Microbacterium gubbeenense]|uniref:hypothetical protein n=1 Tax=Microbacterium gubbeenense TaxID=159896 RepID=UPI003F989229